MRHLEYTLIIGSGFHNLLIKFRERDLFVQLCEAKTLRTITELVQLTDTFRVSVNHRRFLCRNLPYWSDECYPPGGGVDFRCSIGQLNSFTASEIEQSPRRRGRRQARARAWLQELHFVLALLSSIFTLYFPFSSVYLSYFTHVVPQDAVYELYVPGLVRSVIHPMLWEVATPGRLLPSCSQILDFLIMCPEYFIFSHFPACRVPQ